MKSIVGHIFLMFILFGTGKSGSCPGVCQSKSTFSCSQAYLTGLCPGSSDFACCPQSTPSCNSTSDQCQQNSLPCDGAYLTGKCPGSSSIQCCSSTSTCPSSTLFSFGGVPVKQLSGDKAFYWTNKLECDADGAPNAYNPSDTGIDYLANAGSPGNWWGISTDSSGKPYVQGSYPAGSYAPYPGYYVSTTSWENSAYSYYDVRRFADAVQLNFFVLPGSSSIKTTGVAMGDVAFVYSAKTGKSAYAAYGDIGPSSQIGEGSVGLHVALGNNPYSSSGRVVNGISSGVSVLVFPGSNPTSAMLSQSQIDSIGEKQFNSWGGMERFASCIVPGV